MSCAVGQMIPKGLHVRMNMQTGETEAKLLSAEDGSGSREAAGNTLLVFNRHGRDILVSTCLLYTSPSPRDS